MYFKIIYFYQSFLYFFQPLDRDPPLGRSQWKFTVFAQDEGGKGLVGFADVHVILKDINDNAPHFSQKEYVGNITENSPRGKSYVEYCSFKIVKIYYN